MGSFNLLWTTDFCFNFLYMHETFGLSICIFQDCTQKSWETTLTTILVTEVISESSDGQKPEK